MVSCRRIRRRSRVTAAAPARGFGAEFAWDLGPATPALPGRAPPLRPRLPASIITIASSPASRSACARITTAPSSRIRTNCAWPRNGRGPVSAQGGVYWFRERDGAIDHLPRSRTDRPAAVLRLPVGSRQSRTAAALFGQLTWRASERLRLTLGARRTDDRKSRYRLDQPAAAGDLQSGHRHDACRMRPRWPPARPPGAPGAEIDLSPSTLLYATVSTGYKAGGFNDGCAGRDAGSAADRPRVGGARIDPGLPARDADCLRTGPEDALLGRSAPA